MEYSGHFKKRSDGRRFLWTFVISEIIKSYYNKGIADPPLYFYRDKDMKEIVCSLKESILYPIEIKKHADPKKEIRAFSSIEISRI